METHHIPPPCKEEVDIVYADDHILVAMKPSGLLSVPGRFVKDSLWHRMLYEHPDATIVHRLDLDTSGLMVLAQNPSAAAELGRQFRNRDVEKVYEARVFGAPPADGEIDLPIAPDPEHRPRQRIDKLGGKPSLTRYERLGLEGEYGRLLLRPLTGRSHQLRLHLAAIGHPILGCDLYAHDEALTAADRLQLHATGLTLSHPASGKRLRFNSPAPF